MHPADSPDAMPGRRILIRDIAALQVKLLVDGFRDLLLVPASLVVGAIAVLRGRSNEFYDLLRLGRRSERVINLFGALDRLPGASAEPAPVDIDRMVDRVERFVVDEYRHGHLSKQAREQLERAVARLRQTARRHAGDDEAATSDRADENRG